MIIRAEQLVAFEKGMVRNFENRMIEHIQSFSPPHCRILNREQLREVVQLGMVRAKEHGFESQAHIQRYIEIMIQIGSHFDADPQLPWAAKILRDDALVDADLRLGRLDYDTTSYLLVVAGPHNELRDQALRRAKANPPPYGFWGRSPELEAKSEQWLKSTYPEKCEFLGAGGVRALIGAGEARAARFAIISDSGVELLIALMFFLGSSFDEDPQTPWAAPILRDSDVPEQDRVTRLQAVAWETLDQWLM
jgi:hypothetical protein